jgi:hypothetical protein
MNIRGPRAMKNTFAAHVEAEDGPSGSIVLILSNARYKFFWKCDQEKYVVWSHVLLL